jgi:tetratricopeptide (TPR) repeat protein
VTLRRSPLPLSLVALLIAVCAGQAAPLPGFTAAALIARAYDSILNADFGVLPGALATACGSAPSETCDTLEAVGLWWQIALDPDDRSFDAQFSQQVDFAIGATDAWTKREPERAEAWFYHGAAYGARVQWRVLRGERLAAARDGKHIKESMERALALDPGMHDAKFGVGMYRYYAATAPAALRMLRWLLMLPGGDRAGGLQQMIAAHNDGRLVRGEADYQLHVIYLWYERRFDEALALIDSLRARYPRNPLFHQARAEILGIYFHDQTASLRTWEDLLLRAQARLVSEPDLVATRARIKAAEILDRLDETDRAVELLQQVVVDRPSRPARAVPAATAMIPRMRERLAHEPYRIALQGWRAFERGDLVGADRMFTQSLLADPSSPVTRYRYAQVLMADGRDTRAVEELDRVLAMTTTLSPIVRANALFDRAHLAERRGDRTRAQTLYLEASRVFGADRTITERAARLARALEGGARRESARLEHELTSRGRLKLSVEASIGSPF